MYVPRPLLRAGLLCLLASAAHADPLPVRFVAGTAHAFLVLRSPEGKPLANGEAVQVVHGNRVSLRLTLRFRDGSLDEETSVFTQHGTFRLISDRLVQRGPAFPHPFERLIDMPSGNVTTTTEGKNGRPETHTEHQDLPPDLINGLLMPAVLNLPAGLEHGGILSLPYVAPAPRFRIVQLKVEAEGHLPALEGTQRYSAEAYRVHVELGGLAGVVAPIIGKAPEDAHVLRLGGEAPAFLREECQLYEDGPVWRIEQVSATFPDDTHSAQKQ